MNTTAEIPTHNKLGFPVVPCIRCCGEGKMDHYRHVQAGECFQCQGQRVIVKPGKAAKAHKAYMEALNSARLQTFEDLKVGDVFSAGGANTVTHWVKLASIEESAAGQPIYRTADGTMIYAAPTDEVKNGSVKVDPAPYLAGI